MLSLHTIIHLWMTMFILMGIDSLTPGLGVLTFGCSLSVIYGI